MNERVRRLHQIEIISSINQRFNKISAEEAKLKSSQHAKEIRVKCQ